MLSLYLKRSENVAGWEDIRMGGWKKVRILAHLTTCLLACLLTVAPLMVFAVGLIWKKHVSGHRRAGLSTGRRSGLSLVLTMVPMIASGYLIQVTVTDTWRTAWIVIHCTTSGLWITGYPIHQIAALIRKRKSAEKQQESPNLERQPGHAVTH